MNLMDDLKILFSFKKIKCILIKTNLNSLMLKMIAMELNFKTMKKYCNVYGITCFDEMFDYILLQLGEEKSLKIVILNSFLY